jgi:hypothetical protein
MAVSKMYVKRVLAECNQTTINISKCKVNDSTMLNHQHIII